MNVPAIPQDPRKYPRNFREISGKFPEISRKFPEILRDGRNIHFDIVKRQIKNFSIGLQKNNSEIMPDPPVEYLRNVNFTLIIRFFPTGFMYENRSKNT